MGDSCGLDERRLANEVGRFGGLSKMGGFRRATKFFTVPLQGY